MPRRPHDRAFLASFGSRLRELREAAHLTQQRLAEKAGVEPKTISAFESGSFAPTLTTVKVLADTLGVPVPVLFERVGAPFSADPAGREEVEVLESYRALSEEQRRAVRDLLRAFTS